MPSPDDIPLTLPEPPSEHQCDIQVLVKALTPGSAARIARAVVREALQLSGLTPDAVADAEIVVGELAANAERHGRRPYELRLFRIDGTPAWCEVVDADPSPEKIRDTFHRLATLPTPDPAPLAENGRGLLLTHELTEGHCHAYWTTTTTTGTLAKAVAFALPTPTGTRLTPDTLPNLRPTLARLRRARLNRPGLTATIPVIGSTSSPPVPRAESE